MKTISGSLKAHLAQDVTTVCTLWRVTRRDGVVMGFTDHDDDLTFEGLTFTASSGYVRSAVANDATLAVDNVELEGLLDADEIDLYDLRNGVYDYATVEIMLVNWNDLSMGALKLRHGIFGEVQITNNGTFSVELRGLVQHYQTKIGAVFAPECRADLGDNRCRVKVMPDLRVGQRSYKVGDRVRVPPGNLEKFALALRNPSFEEGDGGSRNVPKHWSAPSTGFDGAVDYMEGSNVVQPTDGDTYVLLASTIYQTLMFEDDPSVDLAKVDAGRYVIELALDQIALQAGWTGEAGLTFLAANGGILGTGVSTGLWSGSPLRRWQRRTCRALLPRGTRGVTVAMSKFDDGAGHAGGYVSQMGYDNVEVTLTDWAYGDVPYNQYANVEWRCTKAGVSARVAPAFPTNVGATVTDGTVRWVCERARYVRTDTVDTVLGRTKFRADSLKGETVAPIKKTTPAPGAGGWAAVTGSTAGSSTTEAAATTSGWFDGGLLYFESGRNKGRAYEVKKWDEATKTVTLHLPTTYPIEVGDVFRIQPGCDKTPTACSVKYGNIANYRGEPFVPGSDKYLDVGNPAG